MTLVSRKRIFSGIEFLWAGPQMTVRLSTTAIFGDLGIYFFGNFRDKASNNIWRYAVIVCL